LSAEEACFRTHVRRRDSIFLYPGRPIYTPRLRIWQGAIAVLAVAPAAKKVFRRMSDLVRAHRLPQ